MGTKELTQSKEEVQLRQPPLFKVVLLNDDYTSMDFVVEVLVGIFHHSVENAINIMLNIHEKGKGICGVYTYEIAETKVMQVEKEATKQEFPLRATIEEE